VALAPSIYSRVTVSRSIPILYGIKEWKSEPDGTVRFLLKDGTEIHRIGPPTDVYDHDTGKLVGHVGPKGRFVRLAAGPPAVAVEAAAPKKSNVVILNDVAEAGS